MLIKGPQIAYWQSLWWSVWWNHDSPWWRHEMETFSALLAICAGNSPVPGEFPAQRPVTRSFDVYFELRPNKRLSKQSWGWWFETLSPPLWRHRNASYACWTWHRTAETHFWHTDGLVQERRNSSALAMELPLSCANPSIYRWLWLI